MYLKTRQYRTCYIEFCLCESGAFSQSNNDQQLLKKIFFTILSIFGQLALRFSDNLNVLSNIVDLASVILDYNIYCK
jgi:hypothetical protein